MSKDSGADASYYELPPNCHRLYDVIAAKDMKWDQGNIFKAAYRWDEKPDLIYNLEKIIFHAQEALNRAYAEMRPDHESE